MYWANVYCPQRDLSACGSYGYYSNVFSLCTLMQTQVVNPQDWEAIYGKSFLASGNSVQNYEVFW